MLVKYKNAFFVVLHNLKLKNAVKKFQNMSEVAVGGGEGLKTSNWSLKF